jgi:hypothetical protein
VLSYTSLFDDLESRFKAAHDDPHSYARLAREVERAAFDLREYCAEVGAEYAQRLERRIAQPVTLSAEEGALVRAFLGIAPADAERDRLLLDDLARLEQSIAGLAPLRGRPLTPKNLDVLRRLLSRMQGVLPRIVEALEERERARRFEEAWGDGGPGLDRGWLKTELRRALSPPAESGRLDAAT